MKTTQKVFLALACVMTLSTGVHSQSGGTQAARAMQKDYPGLMALYGDRISEQKAHYIFVVDVSSSMLPYEETVKGNFLKFLNAVPDGDQVTLIKMSDESHTGFVGLLKCTPLDPSTRASIREVVTTNLRFNRNGSSEDGSDGFTMAKCVIDAINVVGSNDLTFVYMLTDFEYWTHKYRYEKGREDWASLESRLPKAKISGMCKYGIELNTGNNLRQEAIFKDELDRIFGKVEYQAVGSASLLSNWFSHVATGVMSVKLNSLLKADWQEMTESVRPSVDISGGDVRMRLDATETPLVNGVDVTFRTDNPYFLTSETTGTFPGQLTVGRLELPAVQKSLLPGYLQIGGQTFEADIALQSPYSDEINRLQGVCGEVAGRDDALRLLITESGTLPPARVWNSVLPVWAWLLLLVLLLIIMASFIYEYALIRLNRKWNVSVKASSPDGGISRFNGEDLKTPFSFGPADSALQVKGAPWAIKVYTKRHNPLTFKKSGYFLELEQGAFADVETDYDDEPKTISVGESVFLCAPGKSTAVNIRIKEKGKTDYKISLD